MTITANQYHLLGKGPLAHNVQFLEDGMESSIIWEIDPHSFIAW